MQAKTTLFTEEGGSVRSLIVPRVTAITVDVIFGLAGFNAAILYMISFIAGFGYKLRRKY
jgi:hypothetical protein